MGMDIKSLREETIVMLHALGVMEYKEVPHKEGLSYDFIIEQFGVMVCVVTAYDIMFIRSKIAIDYKDWRVFYVTPNDDLVNKKEELFFELMRAGYMRWLRQFRPRFFNSIFFESNIGNKIINKRLAIWQDKPRYKFLIEDNKEALLHPTSYLLSMDNGFFDYMPEIE